MNCLLLCGTSGCVSICLLDTGSGLYPIVTKQIPTGGQVSCFVTLNTPASRYANVLRYYPTHQRTLATSVIAVSNYVGVAATFIVGPMLVPKDSDDIDRDTRKYMLYQTL